MSDLANILPAAALALLAVGVLGSPRALGRGLSPGLVAAALAAAVLAFAIDATRFESLVRNDDPYITYRYAENLAAGRGLTYNAGERVLGTTTPLFAGLLAAARVASPAADLPAVAVLLNHALFAAALLLALGLLGPALARGGDRHAALAQLFLLACAALAPAFRTLMFGMEVGLVVFLTAAAPWLLERRALLRWAALLALLVATRVDAALFAGLSVAHLLLAVRDAPRRRVAAALSLLAALLAAGALCTWLYFGSLVPHSVTAKNAVFREYGQGGFALPVVTSYARSLLRDVFFASPEQSLLFALFGVGALRAWRRREPALLFAVAAPLSYLAFLAAFQVTRIGNWYAPGYLLLYYGVCAYGFSGLAGVLHGALARAWPGFGGRGGAWALRAALAAAVLACVVAPGLRTLERRERFYQRHFPTRDPLVCLGNAVRELRPGPADRVLVGDIGKLGYYSAAPILDYVGLVSPEALPYYRAGTGLFGILRGEEPRYAALRVPGAFAARSAIPRPEFLAWFQRRYAMLDTPCDPNHLGYALFVRLD